MMSKQVKSSETSCESCSHTVVGDTGVEIVWGCGGSVLEERFTHSILISLYEQDKQKKTTLLSSISRSSSIGKRIDNLERNGLIHITIDRFNKNTNWIELTDKGRDVSKMLIYIYQRMNE
ncbi:MAG: hypothetical protein FWH47_07750 [Methanomassiliicoccaceae archaeon]|nr:hypothetical protein [Methanomassiliicoccaceae archaeon]